MVSLKDFLLLCSQKIYLTGPNGLDPQEVTAALSTATLEPQVLKLAVHSVVKRRLVAEENQAAMPGSST